MEIEAKDIAKRLTKTPALMRAVCANLIKFVNENAHKSQSTTNQQPQSQESVEDFLYTCQVANNLAQLE